MILVDTSVWIDHLHLPVRELHVAIAEGSVLMHGFIIAELAMGSIPRRAEFIESVQAFPRAATVTDDELLAFVDEHGLFGTGLGMVDGHLLASTAKTPGTLLWARDKKLARQARRLGLAYAP